MLIGSKEKNKAASLKSGHEDLLDPAQIVDKSGRNETCCRRSWWRQSDEDGGVGVQPLDGVDIFNF